MAAWGIRKDNKLDERIYRGSLKSKWKDNRSPNSLMCIITGGTMMSIILIFIYN